MALVAQPVVGDIGTIIELTIKDQDLAVVDISSASTLQILMKAPDGTVTTQTGVLSGDGTDGKMRYVTQAGDWTMHGVWEIQGRAVITAGTFRTRVIRQIVEAAL